MNKTLNDHGVISQDFLPAQGHACLDRLKSELLPLGMNLALLRQDKLLN